MELPESINNSILELTTNCGRKIIVDRARILSDKYRRGNKSNGVAVSSFVDAVCYAGVRMPATFCAISSVLKKVFSLIIDKPQSVIDFGSGCGTAMFSLMEYDFIKKVVCVERQNEMILLGKEFEKSIFSVSIETHWINGDVLNYGSKNEKADLVFAGYMFNEINEEDRKRAFFNMVTASDDLVVLVEPATKANFDSLMKIKTYANELGLNMIAPCCGYGKCGLDNGDWCGFRERVRRTKLIIDTKGGDLSYEDENYFFLAFSKKQKLSDVFVVVKKPVVRKKVVDLVLCKNGKIIKKTIGKSLSEEYKKARSLNAGDIF